MYLGDGEDYGAGQIGDDVMYGGAGKDSIYGGFGNNKIYGEDGEDYIVTDTGNDQIWAGSGVDNIFSGAGDDFIDAGDGDDFVYANSGNDRIDAGRGNDVIYGQDGNDYVRGQDGDDIVYGGAGDDTISGGLGYDVLYGHGGQDGLIGGPGIPDFLVGGGNDDRFLVFSNDVISDFQAVDAKLLFRNNLNLWTSEEMEAVDVALRTMHFRTDNTRLLKDSLAYDPIIMEKVNTLPFGGATRNLLNEYVTNQFNPNTGNFDKITRYERVIQYSDWNEADTAASKLRETKTYSEFGHNWDSTEEIKAVVLAQQFLWTQFLQKSNWTQENPNDPLNYWISGDNQWWYRLDSKFASTFDYKNAYNDWSSIWEVALDESLASERSRLVLKLNDVNQLFTSLSAF
ncbi:MAG: calcium-binding protein [Planctomycetota bacterium]